MNTESATPATGEIVIVTIGATTNDPHPVAVVARNRDVSDEAMNASYAALAAARTA